MQKQYTEIPFKTLYELTNGTIEDLPALYAKTQTTRLGNTVAYSSLKQNKPERTQAIDIFMVVMSTLSQKDYPEEYKTRVSNAFAWDILEDILLSYQAMDSKTREYNRYLDNCVSSGLFKILAPRLDMMNPQESKVDVTALPTIIQRYEIYKTAQEFIMNNVFVDGKISSGVQENHILAKAGIKYEKHNPYLDDIKEKETRYHSLYKKAELDRNHQQTLDRQQAYEQSPKPGFFPSLNPFSTKQPAEPAVPGKTFS